MGRRRTPGPAGQLRRVRADRGVGQRAAGGPLPDSAGVRGGRADDGTQSVSPPESAQPGVHVSRQQRDGVHNGTASDACRRCATPCALRRLVFSRNIVQPIA